MEVSGRELHIRSRAAYDQLETYRQLGVLVCKFGLDRHDPAVAAAAGFLSSYQTQAGDYRGIYGRQYTPNYSAAITELLIRAGYDGSAQVENTMRWLLSMRQDDGGWAIPTRTLGLSLDVMLTARETVEPDRSRPSSHLVTGIVLRALAAHPGYRHSADTRRAAEPGQIAVLPPGRLLRPGRAIELAHLLLSVLVDRPAVRARLPRPARLPRR